MMACCNFRVPAVGVYLVWPSRIASAAAALMFCGVSKSGSPAPRSTTSMPAARIACAVCIAAKVDDAFIRATLSETGNLVEIVVATIVIKRDPGVNLSVKENLFLLAHPLFDERRHQPF